MLRVEIACADWQHIINGIHAYNMHTVDLTFRHASTKIAQRHQLSVAISARDASG